MDRDDALQLPPPRARAEGEGGRPRRGRHADGVQHGRDLRRHHDGHRRHEDVAGQPRGDRGLDRARGPRAPVRRRDRDLRLRQDDPRHRDGARAARPPGPDALRRLDRARPLQRRRRDDPGGVRGGRRPRRRQDQRGRAARARERREPGRRSVRRPVHRQHDGAGLPDPRHLADRAERRPGGGCHEGAGGVRRRAAGDGRARPRSAAERHHHPRRARERDRGDRDERRLDERRPAPPGGRARGRHRAVDRRLRPDRRKDAAAVRPQARGPFRGDRHARRRRHGRRGEPAAGGRAAARGRADRYRPHDRRARARGRGDTRPGGRPAALESL